MIATDARLLQSILDLPESNLRTYAPVPEADPSAPPADFELRQRLRWEQRDEPRRRSWDDQAADDAGKPRSGEL